MQIETMAVKNLRPYPRNSRTHSKKQIWQIAQSIKRFGFCNPVLVDDELQIIAGHGRVEAAKLLQMETVPVVRLSHLTEAEKRAYIIADNRLAEKAGWDREILAIELQALVVDDFEVDLTGFEMGEVDLILEEAGQNETKPASPEDNVELPKDGMLATSKLDDLWILDNHRLLCADAREPGAYEALMDGEKAEFAFTDPPYNVEIDGHVSGLGKVKHREFEMASGEMTRPEFTNFLTAVFTQLVASSSNGSIHGIFMDWRHMEEMLVAGRVYTEMKNLCVWNKTNAGMGSFYRSKHELIFVFKSGTAPHINNFELGQYGRHRSNVWDYAGVNTFKEGRLEELVMHPTVKPVALVADAIKDCSNRRGLVLDPFLGSGTTLIAAERTGRRARTIEIDPLYVDVAVRRWQAFTGKDAILSGTGETFDEVEKARKPKAA
jgi:DNA modification methylase